MAQAATTLSDQKYRFLDVQPISGSLGAEVLGVDIGAINDDVFDEIYRALVENQVFSSAIRSSIPTSTSPLANAGAKSLSTPI